MKQIAFFLLIVLLLLNGCYNKTYILKEGDIYIDKIELIDQNTCEEIKSAMETSKLARYDGYKTSAQFYTYIEPIEGLSENSFACQIIRDDFNKYIEMGRLKMRGWKTGLDKASITFKIPINETNQIYFCCEIVNRKGDEISNELCSKKTFEKIC